MEFKLAERHMSEAGSDFIMEVIERLSICWNLCMGRSLKCLPGHQHMVFRKQGRAEILGKTVKKQRLKRGVKFITKYYPVLRA